MVSYPKQKLSFIMILFGILQKNLHALFFLIKLTTSLNDYLYHPLKEYPFVESTNSYLISEYPINYDDYSRHKQDFKSTPVLETKSKTPEIHYHKHLHEYNPEENEEDHLENQESWGINTLRHKRHRKRYPRRIYFRRKHKRRYKHRYNVHDKCY